MVKRLAIKSGVIAVRSKVSVVWGKSKKTYNAEVVGDGSVAQVQQTNSHEDKPLPWNLSILPPLIPKNLLHAKKDNLL